MMKIENEQCVEEFQAEIPINVLLFDSRGVARDQRTKELPLEVTPGSFRHEQREPRRRLQDAASRVQTSDITTWRG